MFEERGINTLKQIMAENCEEEALLATWVATVRPNYIDNGV
jgi:hypothetical protein